MGSKTPPLGWPSPEAHAEDNLVRRPDPSNGSAANSLLHRIAGALQVPPAALCSLPNAVGAGSPSEVNTIAVDSALESECVAVLLAYRCIRDPEMRRRLLALMQAEAERA